MPKLFDEKVAFSQSNETYIGTWFGHDIWLYDSAGKPNLLAVFGNQPGDYATWIGDASWFDDGKTINYGPGVAYDGKPLDGFKSVPMAEHLTNGDTQRAFMLGFAAIFNRNGGDLSGFVPEKQPMSLGMAEYKIESLKNEILFDSQDPRNDEAGAYFALAIQALSQAEQFMKLANFKDN